MLNRITVALPLPLDQTFEYLCPPKLADRARPGCRAVVPFGKKILTGIIVADTDSGLPAEKLREVTNLPDQEPLLPSTVIDLAKWVSEYYFCSWGEVLKAALPAGFLQAGTRILQSTPILHREMVQLSEAIDPGELSKKASYLSNRAPRQAQILEKIVSEPNRRWLKSELIRKTNSSYQALNNLIEAGILKCEKVQIKRYPTLEALTLADEAPLPQPNPDQAKAIEAISASIDLHDQTTFLLYGVTGSGKTLVYQKAIERVLESGGEALVLIPEISLTPQIVGRFRACFGDKIGLQHSAMSSGERTDVWRGIRAGEFPIVIGARSAVFAPLTKLRLIVVDEEGDSSFKQHEPNPRYHARDVALMRAKMTGATAVLGSATPSVESFNNAITKRFNFLQLPERVDSVPPPVIRFVSPAKRRDKILGDKLGQAITDRVKSGEQIILLQNRRGFFTYVFCPKCKYLCTCKRCQITLVHHKIERVLRCHICGYKEAPAVDCPKCGKPLRYAGTGTQRVEEELGGLVPGQEIIRLDMDTTSSKGSHHKILKSFANEEYAILLGTKMVARGHDYPKVTLVGVVSADTELAFPDFRSDERAFVLLLQAAGRAGRCADDNNPGEVLIQSWMPEHPILRLVEKGDYGTFYEREIKLRRTLNYPPLGWMVLFLFASGDEKEAQIGAERFIQIARKEFSAGQWMGPTPAYRPRLKNQYRFQVILKTSIRHRSTSSDGHKKLKALIDITRKNLTSRVQFLINVDPIQLM